MSTVEWKPDEMHVDGTSPVKGKYPLVTPSLDLD